jgi:hypothetical protein
MIDRAEVEALLTACEPGSGAFLLDKITRPKLAALCRLALEVVDAPERKVISDGEFDYVGASGLGLLGQRVRLVRVGEE